MLTAAVRDLHHWYPGQFVTDVRTCCPDLWENNPHITPLREDDPAAEPMECSYPLINRCNNTPYHCLHGFIEFLNEQLKLSIKPTAFKGDIHLAEQEKAWYSQVHEVTGEDTPFWIVAGGGKYDVTIKWWETSRYQEVIDHFGGKVQFVQVGAHGHHHPRLNGAIDLRGQTSLRELIRLVYHSQGVICSVTALMHLAAAVETKKGRPRNRPCVVIAGGREPAHWEAYPDHQFIHTNGVLACCANGGCWKDRIVPLRDGDNRDKPGQLCVDVIDGLPHCMDMITPAEVVRRVEIYFRGGLNQYLSPSQVQPSKRGVLATAKNSYDEQPLNLHNAGMACEQFIKTIPAYPDCYEGRGIVICGGGARYFTNAWVCINMLRRLGCRLPIQLWHLGRKEMDAEMKALLTPLGVECIDARRVQRKFPARILNGWELKAYSILQCPFREVLLLDADNVPVVDPGFLLETPEFERTGAIFWPDYENGKNEKAMAIWKSCGMRKPKEAEFETGQIVVDKQRCWAALQLCMWFNENSDFYYRHIHGDKETYHLAFRKMKKAYSLIQTPIHSLDGTMCQHDFQGRRIFQHRNQDKWDVFLRNRLVEDFRFEKECRSYVAQLQRIWRGGMGPGSNTAAQVVASRKPRGGTKIEAVMISCVERNEVRRKTLDNLARSDWGETPIHVEMDEGNSNDPKQRQTRCAYLALKKSLRRDADYILFLEDDLDFNRRIRSNLLHWSPLKAGVVTLAGLYNPGIRELAGDVRNNARIVDPNSVFGSQALLISRETVSYLVRHWDQMEGMQDIRISRLAALLKNPVYYHAPSMVQHVGAESVWGGRLHQAIDFDAHWTAQESGM
ncbi:MAG: ADP-heptose:LPS heptosyltransferase-like protein [Pedosphaera sp.]|nr:ADP-heptose:LPS heptosyltransferase-like protein [Pedosphaera sp.]